MGHVLWLVNHYAALPSEPGGTRHYWLSKGLQNLGWDVRMIRSGSTHSPHRPWSPQVEVVDGIQVTTIPGPPLTARGLTRVRSWAEFSAWVQAPPATKHLPKPDLVIGSTVHLGAAWAARNLAERHGAPFVLEVRDLWPETLVAMGALKRRSGVARAMLRVEGTLAGSAALIVSPLSGAGEYMSERHGIPPERFVWVSNGVNSEQYAATPPPPQSGLRLQYFGAVGTANDVTSIIDSVEQANRLLPEPVHLQVFGIGPNRDTLMKRVAASPVLAPVVGFPAPVPSHEVPKAMAWGNALVLTVRHLPGLYRYGISMNKLFDYLASGRWILMGSDVQENPIADAPGLSLCEPSVEGLTSAIVRAARMDPRARARIARGNIAIAQDRFDYRVLARVLGSSLEDVIRDHGAARKQS